MADRTIGSTGDHSTIANWEAYLNTTAPFTSPERGLCQAQNFPEDPVFQGSASQSQTNYIELTAADGDTHDGRAQNVSSHGGARVTQQGTSQACIQTSDEWTRISWLEVIQSNTGTNNAQGISCGSQGTTDNWVHHCLVHQDGLSSGNAIGIYIGDSSITGLIYRNIVYGNGGTGIYYNGADGGIIVNNSLHKTGESGGGNRRGIWWDSSNSTQDFANNISYINDSTSPDSLRNDGSGTYTKNGCDDASGTEAGLDNLTADDVDFTGVFGTDYLSVDLTPLSTSILVDYTGVSSYSAATYPEIDVSADKGTGRATISGDWDIGAIEFVSGAPAATVAEFVRSSQNTLVRM